MKNGAQFLVVTGLVAALAVSRWIPHPPNFSPVLAMALLGGAIWGARPLAFLVPIGAMILSDAVLGFHSTLWAVYLAMALAVILGRAIAPGRDFSWVRSGSAALAASLVFFALTNFAVWLSGELYPTTWEGLITCYAMAIPFFPNTLLSTVLFGGAALWAYSGIERRVFLGAR